MSSEHSCGVCGTREGCIAWSYTLKYGAVSLSKGSVSARPPNGLAWREGRCARCCATPLRRLSAAPTSAEAEAGSLHREIVDQILIDDQERPKKQRHTAKRIFDRLRDEYDFTGGYTIVKDYVRDKKLGGQEMFVAAGASAGRCPGRLR